MPPNGVDGLNAPSSGLVVSNPIHDEEGFWASINIAAHRIPNDFEPVFDPHVFDSAVEDLFQQHLVAGHLWQEVAGLQRGQDLEAFAQAFLADVVQEAQVVASDAIFSIAAAGEMTRFEVAVNEADGLGGDEEKSFVLDRCRLRAYLCDGARLDHCPHCCNVGGVLFIQSPTLTLHL